MLLRYSISLPSRLVLSVGTEVLGAPLEKELQVYPLTLSCSLLGSGTRRAGGVKRYKELEEGSPPLDTESSTRKTRDHMVFRGEMTRLVSVKQENRSLGDVKERNLAILTRESLICGAPWIDKSSPKTTCHKLAPCPQEDPSHWALFIIVE